MRIALEIEHRVYDVLQYAGAGDRAFLGDMSHENNDYATLFRKSR